MDHVPPRAFFPKELRTAENPNLSVAPTHRRCNEHYREDEEYFYHYMYALVGKINPRMGQTIIRDFERRSTGPQTPAMLRRMLKSSSTVTEGGIHLPPGVVKFTADRHRIETIVLKIAQGLFFLERERYMPRELAQDIHVCESEDDVPELYRLTWRPDNVKGACPAVFSYRYFQAEAFHIFSMLFWEAILCCTTFVEEQTEAENASSIKSLQPT